MSGTSDGSIGIVTSTMASTPNGRAAASTAKLKVSRGEDHGKEGSRGCPAGSRWGGMCY